MDYEKLWEMQRLKLAESASVLLVTNKKLENASDALEVHAESVPLRKFSISDFNLLKVLGRGSFGKVRDSGHDNFTRG
jgi:hypothetical protein